MSTEQENFTISTPAQYRESASVANGLAVCIMAKYQELLNTSQ